MDEVAATGAPFAVVDDRWSTLQSEAKVRAVGVLYAELPVPQKWTGESGRGPG
jgi:hypothetical protein